MIYVTVDSPVHSKMESFVKEDFFKFMGETYPGSEIIFRWEQSLRVYYHRDTSTFIIVRGLL